MASTLVVITVIALLDSISMVPIALVPLAAMLGGSRPFIRAFAFLAGIGAFYYGVGMVLLFGVGQLFAALNAFFERVWFEPNRLELALQIAVGAILMILAWRLVRVRGAEEQPRAVAAGAGGAFALGALLALVGLPGAVPYLGAIDQVLRADLGLVASGLMVLAYNVAFLMPLLLLVGVRALLPSQSGKALAAVGDILARWGTRAAVVLLSLLGAVMIIDGIGWFLGHPLIPVGTPPPGL